MHALQLVSHAARLTDDFHEQAAGPDILAKFLVDEIEVLANEADGAGAHALDARVLLHQKKNLEQRGRRAFEDVLVDRLDEITAHLKAA